MTASPAPAEQQLPTHHRSSGRPDPGQQPDEETECGHVILFCMMTILIGGGVLFVFGGWVCLIWSSVDQEKQPRYHVAIDAVSGLDPETDLGRPKLDPEFNLTVGLASRQRTQGWCFYGGSTVRVSYRGVQLAGEALPGLCVGPRQYREQGSVVAWGSGVRVPRLVRDALARDLRRGAAEFDIALSVEAPMYSGFVVVSCKAVVGDAAASRDRCAASPDDARPEATRTSVGPVSYGYSPAPENGGAD